MADSPQRRIPKRPGVVLAAAVVLVVVGVRVLSGPGNARFRTGNEIVLLAPTDAALISEPRFSWRRFPTATSYELHILNDSGDSVYSIMTADTTLLLPANAGLVPNQEYVWSVRALVVGEARAGSRGARFTLRR